MPEQRPTTRELGLYFSLAQVGVEMVLPVVLGIWLDAEFGWFPWGVVVGAILGLTVGVLHLVAFLQRFEKKTPAKDKQDSP